MSASYSAMIIALGFNVGLLVFATAVSILARVRHTLLESRGAPTRTASDSSIILAMAVFHPKSWLVLGLLGYGGYKLASGRLSATMIMFYWGVAASAVALTALLFLRTRRRTASITSNGSSNVA